MNFFDSLLGSFQQNQIMQASLFQQPNDILIHIFSYMDDAQHLSLVCKRFRSIIRNQKKTWQDMNAYELLALKLTPLERMSFKVWESYFQQMQKALESVTLNCLIHSHSEVKVIRLLKLIGPAYEPFGTEGPLNVVNKPCSWEHIITNYAQKCINNCSDPNNYRSKFALLFHVEKDESRGSPFAMTSDGTKALAKAIVNSNINALIISTCLRWHFQVPYPLGFDDKSLLSLCEQLPDNILFYLSIKANISVSKKNPEMIDKIKRIVSKQLDCDFQLQAPGRQDKKGCYFFKVERKND